MTLAESVIRTVDWEQAKKAFFLLSLVSLALIPIDGIWISLQKPKQAAPSAFVDMTPIKLDSENTYLAAFERSALFGGASPGMTSPALQISLAERLKDYRLKGVVILPGESEALVEDVKTQRTLFIKTGEMLGGLAVKEIGEGFIVLSYLGSEARLEIQ